MSTTLAHLGNMLYRIMTIVRTTKSIRVIDPAQVYHGLTLAPRPRCSHSKSKRKVHPWTFDEVMQGWNAEGWNVDGFNDLLPSPLVHVALLENSILEQNIAAGFAAGRCVLQTKGCCFGCLVDYAHSHRFFAILCHGGAGERKLIERNARDVTAPLL